VKNSTLEKVDMTFNQNQNYPPYSQQYGGYYFQQPHSGFQQPQPYYSPTIKSSYQPAPFQPPIPGPSPPPAQQTTSNTKKIIIVVAVVFAIILLGWLLGGSTSSKSSGEKTPDKKNYEDKASEDFQSKPRHSYDEKYESTKSHNQQSYGYSSPEDDKKSKSRFSSESSFESSSSESEMSFQKPPSYSKPSPPSKPPSKPDNSSTPTSEITRQQLRDEISVFSNSKFYNKFAEHPLRIKVSHLDKLKEQLRSDCVLTRSNFYLGDKDKRFEFLYIYNRIQEFLQVDRPFTEEIVEQLAKIEPTIVGYGIPLDLTKVHEKVQSCIKLLPPKTLSSIHSELERPFKRVLEDHNCNYIYSDITHYLLLLNYIFPCIK
jgi:hypothetical protein